MRISDFFYLHKSDRRVLTAFLLVAVVALGGILYLDTLDTTSSDAAVATSKDSLQFSKDHVFRSEEYVRENPTVNRLERFAFDPNTADSMQLIRLGLKSWQVRNIYKFRAAGGIYRFKEDFAQLYGLTLKEYHELEPYITISADYQQASNVVRRVMTARDSLSLQPKIAEDETIDLCTADTTVLKSVPGIGPYFAREIVRHREWLGGFANVDQLDEIDGFPAKSKKFFRIDQLQLKRLNLNKLTLNELKRHPYINYYQAKAIVDYRRKNGKLESLEQLRLLPEFTPEQQEKLAPYIEF
jgi:DNA uptake protein ComE-like DNA-binding protein